MNRRDIAVVAILVLLLTGFGAALSVPQPAAPIPSQGEPTPGPSELPPATYREGMVGTPTSITPVTARSRVDRTLVGLVFSGLVRLGPGNRFEPDLAASWSVDDTGTTWTFRLRDDATWQDGAPVTPEDVVYTIEALKSPDAAGAVASSWAEVTVRAVDERTVELKLASPIGGFLAAATQPLLPSHLLAEVPFADLAADPFALQPVGSGPFALTELDASHAVLLPSALVAPPAAEPSPTSSVDSLASPGPLATPSVPVPYLERIELKFYPDAAALASALRAGEVDAASGLPPDQLAALDDLAGVAPVRYPTTTLSVVLLNLRPSHPELRDARVRQALLAAVDRDALVRDTLGGNAMRADALVPPGSAVFDAASVTSPAHSPEAAASLLADAGWKRKGGTWSTPKGTDPYRIELLTVPADANPRLAAEATAVRDAWTALGIGVDMVQVPAPEIADRLRSGTFGAAVVDIATGIEPDLYPLLASAQVRASGSNLSGYQDPAMDKLLQAARAPGTPDVRIAAWRPLLKALSERQPMLPLAWMDEVVLVRGVEGITPRLIPGPGDRFWDVLAWRLAADR